MAATKLIEALKRKEYHPVYLLHGEESYYIDLISDYIEENVLDPSQQGFDQTVLYGKETDFVTVLNAARRFPMLAGHQVIIVKEAQNLKWKSEDEILLKYLENPMPSTILVFAYKHGKLDKRKKFYKVAEKIGVAFESAKIYEDKIAGWVLGFLKNKNRSIHPQAAALLGEYLGADLSKVVNELEKLMLNVSPEREINLQDIEQYIGISKDFNMFEFSTALGQRNSLKAYRIAAYFGANPSANPLLLIVGTLAGYFTKILKYHYLPDKSPQSVARELAIHPFFTREYETVARHYNRKKTFEVIHLLHEYDIKSKGVGIGNVPQGDLLKEMVFRILN